MESRKKDVDTILSEKGLRKLPTGENPDLYVYYHVMTQEVIDSTSTDDGFGWGGGHLESVGAVGVGRILLKPRHGLARWESSRSI